MHTIITVVSLVALGLALLSRRVLTWILVSTGCGGAGMAGSRGGLSPHGFIYGPHITAAQPRLPLPPESPSENCSRAYAGHSPALAETGTYLISTCQGTSVSPAGRRRADPGASGSWRRAPRWSDRWREPATPDPAPTILQSPSSASLASRGAPGPAARAALAPPGSRTPNAPTQPAQARQRHATAPPASACVRATNGTPTSAAITCNAAASALACAVASARRAASCCPSIASLAPLAARSASDAFSTSLRALPKSDRRSRRGPS